MRQSIAVAVLAVSLIGRLSEGHEQAPCSLLVQKNWVRFDLILGRISATQIRGGHRNCAEQSGPTPHRREFVSVSGISRAPAIRYEREDSDQLLTIEIIGRDKVLILREPQPGSTAKRFEFVQPCKGPIRMKLGDPGHPIAHVSAESIWHLMLAEPDLCRRELIPILDLLRPHWNLPGCANRIETELFRAAADNEAVATVNIQKLVASLNSPEFAQRQRADQKLRAMGVVILSHLQQLDQASLTREQRQRVRRIETDMAVLKPDTPERIVAWLLNDQSVWLAMLSRRDPDKRQVAADRLAAVHPAASTFDPLAEEAQRAQQINALRLHISARR